MQLGATTYLKRHIFIRTKDLYLVFESDSNITCISVTTVGTTVINENMYVQVLREGLLRTLGSRFGDLAKLKSREILGNKYLYLSYSNFG